MTMRDFPNQGMTIAEAVEKLSGRALLTMPTPGYQQQTRANLGRHRPAVYTWIPLDPSRPILVPGEAERAFAELVRACSSGLVELKYRHSDNPLQLQVVDLAGLSAENLDPLKSEVVFGGSRFPVLVLVKTEPPQPPSDSLRERGDSPEQVPARRRGPKPGMLDRYRDSDRALYPQLVHLMRAEQLSRTAAAMKLAEAGLVPGVGSLQSRAKRLASRYERDRGK